MPLPAALPVNNNAPFEPDYPWAYVWPAHRNNYYLTDLYTGEYNQPRGFVIHTPEEPAGDNYPGTPIWFARDLLTEYGYRASTHYFIEAIEDPRRPGFCKVYQCVPERYGAVANGVLGKPYPAWADPRASLNFQALSVEFEGHASSIHITATPMQLRTLAHLIAHRAAHYGWPTDREHTIGHYQVANNRTDPGPLFPWSALMQLLNEGEEEVFTRWGGEANRDYWHGREITAPIGLGARKDWGVPPDAKAVEVEVFLLSGGLTLYDGGTANGRAGFVDARHGQINNNHFRVALDAKGDFWMQGDPVAVVDKFVLLGWYDR